MTRDLDALVAATEPAPPHPWHGCWDEADALDAPPPLTPEQRAEMRAHEARVRAAFERAGWGRHGCGVVVLIRRRDPRGGCPSDYVAHVANLSCQPAAR